MNLLRFLPGLSPVCGKALDARFDGGLLSSDAGLLVFRQVEKKLKIGKRLAACIPDPRPRSFVGLANTYFPALFRVSFAIVRQTKGSKALFARGTLVRTQMVWNLWSARVASV